MKKRLLLYFILLMAWQSASAVEARNLTVRDGLPNNEVRQLIELPNGQILVNCEGAFCLFNGSWFVVVPCDRRQAYRRPHFTEGYAHLWQGDSLLWLRDFYRVYLLDARKRLFLPLNISEGGDGREEQAGWLSQPALRDFVEGRGGTDDIMNAKSSEIQMVADSAHVSYGSITTACTDRQGGTWLGTRDNGIFYMPPPRAQAETVRDDQELLRKARGFTDSRNRLWICNQQGLDCYEDGRLSNHYDQHNVAGFVHSSVQFVCELADGRLLLCNKLNHLGYFSPERKEFQPLSKVNASVRDIHRNIVGACQLPEADRVAVYTQNGAFVLDTKADTLCPFVQAKDIEPYGDKYNCMFVDRQQRLWIGTQNGLFCAEKNTCRRVSGLKNDCIRSMVEDDEGDLWVGTSCGISRIRQEMVTNFGPDDGIPEMSMLERCACRTSDGHIAFVQGGVLIVFRPEQFREKAADVSVKLVGLEVCRQPIFDFQPSILRLPYDQNHLQVQFSALNYATPDHTRYRYRLVGLDQDWQYVPGYNGLCSVDYNALAPGRYTFEAQAAIDNGEWGPVLQKTFVINPPLWLTWWVKLLYLILVAAVVGYAIHIYLKRRKAKMEHENDQRVNHLFELREEARHQFAKNVSIDASKIAVNSEEEKLVAELLKAIEAHIEDEDYNVDMLARDISMSRTNLYKKVQNMLGITPTDFIRNVRLKRAATLLADTSMTISEIAARVGFATPRNFSAQFKKMFGLLPSDYRQEKSNKVDR